MHNQEDLDSVADLMDNRPLHTLDWRSPYPAFREFSGLSTNNMKLPFIDFQAPVLHLCFETALYILKKYGYDCSLQRRLLSADIEHSNLRGVVRKVIYIPQEGIPFPSRATTL